MRASEKVFRLSLLRPAVLLTCEIDHDVRENPSDTPVIQRFGVACRDLTETHVNNASIHLISRGSLKVEQSCSERFTTGCSVSAEGERGCSLSDSEY